MSKIVIVMSTFDGYSSVARLCVEQLLKLNLGLNIVVVSDLFPDDFPSNEQLVARSTVDDLGWVKNMQLALGHLNDDDYAIVTMDDLWVSNPLGVRVFTSVIEEIVRRKLDIVKLYEPPTSRIMSSIETSFGGYADVCNHKYPVSCMFSILKVSVFRHLLNHCTNAWDFERRAEEILKSCDEDVGVWALGFNLVDVKNLVVKGVTVPSRVSGLELPGVKRMTHIMLLKYYAAIFFGVIRSFSLSKFMRYVIR